MKESRGTDNFADLWSNPVSRRSVLRAAGIGTGAALGGLSILTACTSAAPRGGESRDAFSGALPGPFLDLDPLAGTSEASKALNMLVYSGLYQLDPFPPRTKLMPDLAVGPPQAKTATRYEIGIRSDVTFHDGSRCTAEDVAFTLDRVRDAKASPLFSRFFDIIADVQPVGSDIVQVELKVPTTLLAERLALVKILSKSAVAASPETLKLKPVGTGPYRVLSAVSDQKVELERFDKYHNRKEYHLKTLSISIVGDGNARVAGLRSRDFDAILDVPASNLKKLQELNELEVKSLPSNDTTALYFNCGKPPFNDVRMRQAVLYAVNRDAITTTSFFGEAEPAWKSYFRSEVPDYAVPKNAYRYDPGRARKLLLEAGYSDRNIQLQILIPDIDATHSQGPIIAQNLRDVGFVPTVVPGDYAGHLGRLAEGRYHIFLGKSDPTAHGATDLEFQLRWQWYGYVPRNLLHWGGTELTEVEGLLDKARNTPDPAARRSLLSSVQEIIQEQVPVGALHHRNRITAWSDDLESYRPVPATMFVLDGVTK